MGRSGHTRDAVGSGRVTCVIRKEAVTCEIVSVVDLPMPPIEEKT